MVAKPLIDPARLRSIQDQFEAALPKINKVLRFRLRRLHGEEKDEAIAEALAMTWRDYLNLHLKGRDPEPLVNKIAEFAARSVVSGGRLTGHHPVNDVMSPVARHRHGHTVQSASQSDDEATAPEVLHALRDRGTSPADQAVLNVDFSEWLEGLDQRHRAAAEGFAAGMDNTAVGRLQGAGRGTGSHLRCELRESWDQRFGAGNGRGPQSR